MVVGFSKTQRIDRKRICVFFVAVIGVFVAVVVASNSCCAVWT